MAIIEGKSIVVVRNKAQEEAASVLATGEASMAQLAMLFRTDAKTLPRRMLGLIPTRVQGGIKYYSIAEAATRIVKPGYSIEGYIKSMNHTELPPMVAKEFWNAQNARIKFEQTIGALMPVEDVAEMTAHLLGTVRMSLLLMADSVERQASLTEKQRQIIKAEIDGAIDETRNKLIERFKDYGNGRYSRDYFLDFATVTAVDRGDDAGRPVLRDARVPSSEDYEEDDDGI